MTISFPPSKTHLKPIEVAANEAQTLSLMALLLKSQLPVASSCKGDGICSKCRVRVLEGKENLNPESALESKMKQRNKVGDDERLSCQLHLTGDIVIDTTYW